MSPTRALQCRHGELTGLQAPAASGGVLIPTPHTSLWDAMCSGQRCQIREPNPCVPQNELVSYVPTFTIIFARS